MRTLRERFESHFEPVGSDECWEWQGKRWRNGYGCFHLDRYRTTGAHRAAWEFANGQPIPEGLEIDHLCSNRPCVNPAHMEVVTHAENMRRARGWKKEPKAHCKHGHAFDEQNTTHLRDGRRVCRTCQRERQQKLRGPRKRPAPRPCAVCGKVFAPDRHPRAKYCSGACNTAAFRQRQSAPNPPAGNCEQCGKHRPWLHHHGDALLCANCCEES